MKVVPILISWGLFTGPKFTYMLVPDGKPTPPEDEERHKADKVRQESQYLAWVNSGEAIMGGLAPSRRCSCYGRPL